MFILIPISKNKLAVFTNYPSVTKDQVFWEETVLTLFYLVRVHSCFQPVSVSPIADTIACHDIVKGELSKVGLEGLYLVHTK